jgi:polar amino acid transport system substrate-binding protein
MLPGRPALFALAATGLLVLAAACTTSHAASSGVTAACSPAKLVTRKPGWLTLSTGAITRAPWVVGTSAKGRTNDPRLGRGYDSAVGFALAKRLGFDQKHVAWVGTPFYDSVKAGAKPFDVSINQATISGDRRKDVDMTSPYWVAREVVLTLKNRPLAGMSELRLVDATPLAVVEGSTAAQVRGLTLVRYPDLDKVRAAVSTGAQQGMVTDYNTGLRIAQDERELVNGELVALLPARPAAEGFGMVLQKDSPLTGCVDHALHGMRADGSLAALEQRWLIDEVKLHDLK